jgi:hypothetical protein
MSQIDNTLHGITRLFVDTAPLIYLIEQHPVYLPIVREVVRRIDEGVVEAYSSVITLTKDNFARRLGSSVTVRVPLGVFSQ